MICDQAVYNERSKRQLFEIVFKVLVAIICIMAFVPFVSAARFAVFSGDDFSFYNSVQRQSGGVYFIRCLQEARLTYMTWQGTYLANLANTLFNPLQWYSYAALRLILIGCLLASFCSLAFFSVELSAAFGLSKKWIYVFAAILLPMLSYGDYSEIYLWYIGAMAYQLPVIFLILGFAFLMRERHSKKKLWACLASVSFFLVGGGPLNIGGVAAWLLLMFLVIEYIQERKIRGTNLFYFFSIFVGDLINTAAPGNYARNGSLGGLNITAALGNAISLAVDEYAYLLTSTGLIIFIVAAFLMGRSLKIHIKISTLIIGVAGLCITPVVALFPYMLGYNISSESLEMFFNGNRTLFVVDASIIVSLEFAAAIIGAYTAEKICIKSRKKALVLKGAAAAAMLCIALLTVKQSIPVMTMRNLMNGSIEAYGSDWHQMYDLLRDSPGQDVVFETIPEACIGTLSVSYASYPDHPVNRNWAEYFGNNSVCTGYYIFTQNNS